MKTQQFSNLIKLAQTLKWLVWAYDVPDYSKVEPGTDHETAKLIAPRKRIYVLKSPYGVPMLRDGAQNLLPVRFATGKALWMPKIGRTCLRN